MRKTDIDNGYVVPRGKGLELVKEGKYMVTEDDLTLGGRLTVQYTDHVPQKCMLETCIILLTSVTPIHVICKKRDTFSY